MEEIYYDKQEDVLDIQFSEKEYWKSLELEQGIVLDLAEDGSLIGIEIPRASELFQGEFQRVIDKAKAVVSHA